MKTRTLFSVVVIASAIGLFGCDSGEASADLTGYRAGPGAREITVVYVQGVSDSPGHVEILEESSARVKVSVLYRRAEGNQIALGVVKEAVGTLAEPLGNREVLDEDGTAVPQK